MYQLAICDDEEKELNKIDGLLTSYRSCCPGYEFSIVRFRDVEDLLEAFSEREIAPDILFLDIYMPGKLGIHAAREIREMGNECQIVFFTTSREHALEAFQVNAAQYLVKPVSQKELFSLLDKLLEKVSEEKYLLLQVDKGVWRVPICDIVFIEAQKKHQHMHLAGREGILLKMTMTKLYEMLSGYREFAKAGASYIVNLKHIEHINMKELMMDNGKKIYLPRGSYQILRELYFEYYCSSPLQMFDDKE